METWHLKFAWKTILPNWTSFFLSSFFLILIVSDAGTCNFFRRARRLRIIFAEVGTRLSRESRHRNLFGTSTREHVLSVCFSFAGPNKRRRDTRGLLESHDSRIYVRHLQGHLREFNFQERSFFTERSDSHKWPNFPDRYRLFS